MTNIDKPEEHFLSNGIPVILQNLNGAVGTFHWWNRTGSTDERPEEAGFAHFLEHMLFKDAGAKDTGMASTGQTARVIESLGGEINAYTSFDQTVYHVTCSEQYWEKAIDQFGIMSKPQRFLKEDFEREREVILEELRRGEDSPDRQLYQSLFGLTYKKHPYGRPVIGYVKTLKAATVHKLESYYQRNYVSGKMGLVLVGPIHDRTGARKKKLLSILEKRFGKGTIPKRAAAPRAIPHEKAIQKSRFLAKNFDIKNPELALSFRVPELRHPDAPLLEVLSGVLGSGESSRLYQKLFYEKSLVTETSASVYIPKDPGMFLVSAELKKTGDFIPVLKLLQEEIAAVSSGDVKKDEIDRVMANIESEKLYATQTVDGLAGRLGFLRFSLGDLRFDSEYLEHIKQATPSTLKRLAHEYLGADRMSLVLFQPKGESPAEFEEARSIVEKLPKVKPASIPKFKQKESLQPEIFTTPGGLQVSYFERAGSPVYSLHASAFGGSRSELTLSPRYWGASNLLAHTWTKGTADLSSKEISRIVEGSAASLDGFGGRNTVGLQSTGLVRDWEKLSGLFNEILLEPAFPDDEIEHSKRVTEEQIRSIPDHSSQVCSKLFMENLFEEHPYGKHPLGSLEQLAALGRNDLRSLHETFITPKNMALSIVGGVSRDEVESWLTELDSNLSKRKSTFSQGLLAPPAPLKAPRWAGAEFGREQTHIMVGGLGISMHHEDRYALRILQNILGGQSGRLFIELREKRSMAYSVAPLSMEGIETGYVGTYIACAPGKKDEAIKGMRTVLEDLARKGPTKSEMERAKNYYLGQRAMDLQSSWSIASSFGLELLYKDRVTLESEVRKRVTRVNAAAVQRVCEPPWTPVPSRFSSRWYEVQSITSRSACNPRPSFMW
ncbi:MAG: insulinase family protein [Proteobacteria bacterium]|nr:insulinase family protein [Pseudomonadota bacterium]